uniref:ATP synthase F0 subunit 8 n=1 Tax=Anaxilaus musgravei TaxID=2893314 RepID=UPI001FA762CA|nr:ATP synthase F0 subunit 8 [Anaxilaus musgravei]QUT09469.1 ATP synthase F0 subunit 8 [Anaxilaus musgravei]
MPQMAPLWWESLFLLFIVMFMMMTSMNYFLLIYKMNKSIKMINKSNQMNWMW